MARPSKGNSMKYVTVIPCVNRIDLLREAIDSIKSFWGTLVLIDNTGNKELTTQNFGKDFPIVEPIVPLTFSQTMNAVMRIAFEKACDFYITMHNDALADGGTPEQLLALIQQLFEIKRNWGVVFTHYDALCAFNTEAVRTVGQWDTILPQYFADNDYYRRVRMKGYETVDSGLTVFHQNEGSNTIKADLLLRISNSITFNLYKQYYAWKWGGEPGREQYTVPFNIKV